MGSSKSTKQIRLENEIAQITKIPHQNWRIKVNDKTNFIIKMNLQSYWSYSWPFNVKINLDKFDEEPLRLILQDPGIFQHPQIDKSGLFYFMESKQDVNKTLKHRISFYYEQLRLSSKKKLEEDKVKEEEKKILQAENRAREEAAILQQNILKSQEQMKTNVVTKLKKEINELQRIPSKLWRVQQSQENFPRIALEVIFNQDTPFHSKPFKLDVDLNEYPRRMEFNLEKPWLFYHPNIDFNAKKTCCYKQPKECERLSLRERIDTFLNYIKTPNPQDPLNKEAAAEFMKDVQSYNRKAYSQFRSKKLLS